MLRGHNLCSPQNIHVPLTFRTHHQVPPTHQQPNKTTNRRRKKNPTSPTKQSSTHEPQRTKGGPRCNSLITIIPITALTFCCSGRLDIPSEGAVINIGEKEIRAAFQTRAAPSLFHAKAEPHHW